MKQRQDKLLSILKESKGWIKGKDLAAALGVTPRTIRNDMDALKTLLPDGALESSNQYGYRVHPELLGSDPAPNSSNVPHTPQERRNFILKLLVSEKSVNVSTLPSLLYVSPYTIDADLRAIRSGLEESGNLLLVSKGNRCRLDGSEVDKRHLYKELLSQEVEENFMNLDHINDLYPEFDLIEIINVLEDCLNRYDCSLRQKELLSQEVEENFMNLDHINDLYPEFDLIEIINVLEDCLNRYDCSLRQTSLPMLYMHVGIALQRLLHFHPVSQSEPLPDLSEQKEYLAAQLFYQKMSRRYHLQVPGAEVEQLAFLLMGRSYQAYLDDDVVIGHQRYKLSFLITQIFEEIRKDLNVDLEPDQELMAGLEMHIRNLVRRVNEHVMTSNVYLEEIRWKFPLIFDMGVSAAHSLYKETGMLLDSLVRRVNEHVMTSNVYLEEIRWKFPLIFDMGVSAAHSLYKETGMLLDSHEIGFLALHFGTAYTLKQKDSRYQAVALFPHDYPMGKLVIDKIRRQFSERMEITACLNAFEEKKIRYLKPDLILSTLPVSHHLPIPTVSVSVFYSAEDESAIFQSLNALDRQKGRKLFISRIQQLIRPEFFYTDLEADTPEQAIESICHDLHEAGFVPKEYLDSVLEREGFAPTSFNSGFALPHALNVDAIHSNITFAFLKKPVQWGSFSVDLIVMLSIREEDRDLISVLFDWWIQTVSDVARYESLKCCRNYSQFMQAILEE